LTDANRNDVTQLQALVQAIPAMDSKRGGPLSKPRVVQGDEVYAHGKYRRRLQASDSSERSVDRSLM
jgi:hypothetical protein